MEERTIIIADRDVAYRGRVAGFFRKAGYHVEATGSADQLLKSVQEQQVPVLLLGNDFAGMLASADLVRLLKKCNSRLQVILMSDGMTPAQTRLLRAEGIFFHALKPATAGEADEVGQAVACAFEKLGMPRIDLTQAALQRSASKRLAREQLMNALPWAAGILSLFLGTNYLSLPATPGSNGSSLTVWMFLCFSALVVTGQVLPIFRSKQLPGQAEHRQAVRESATQGGK